MLALRRDSYVRTGLRVALGSLLGLLSGCTDPLVGEWELRTLGEDPLPLQGGTSACSQTLHFSLVIHEDMTGKFIPTTRSRISSISNPMSALALPVTVEVLPGQDHYQLTLQDKETALKLDCTRYQTALSCTAPGGEAWEFTPARQVPGGAPR